MNNENNQQQEMLALSNDIFSVDELEERLELATVVIVDSLCNGNVCLSATCAANVNTGW